MKTLARSSDKAEILQRLREVRPSSVGRWGRMSAHQMVCHLSDSFRAFIGERPVSHKTSLPRRTIMKWMVLYFPLPWPTGIQTRPEIDQELGGTRPVDFASDVRDLEALLELVTAARRTFEWRPHPIMGRMSDAAWLRFGYLHMNHHLRQFGA